MMNQRIKDRLRLAFVAVYAVAAIAAFGHAWHRLNSASMPGDMQVIFAAFCGVVWPAYSSIILWEKFNARQQ